MKNLSANKMIALAACAASTASSTTSSTSSSTQKAAGHPNVATRGALWVVRNAPRGGSNKSDDDDARGKSKKFSSSNNKPGKKKKSTRSTREETKPKNAKTTKSNPLLEEIIRQDNLYDILGVSKTASDREIQKAYRKRCVQTHPDKTGGDRHAFDKVAEAYEVLSDSTKRQTYNRFGKAGLDPTNPSNGAGAFGGGSADMFRNMFQQAQQQRQQQQRRNQTLRYQLEVTLEDLYYGRTQSVTVAPPHSRRHTYQQQRQQRKKVEVHIDKGSISGQSIVMSGEVDFNNDDGPPGDLVFIVTQKPHSTFTRKGHDLAMELIISLEEALCGLRRSIKHLDGSEMWIESATRQSTTDANENEGDNSSIPMTIRTGDVHVLKGRGMPKRNQNGEFGDLYVQYRVDMPQSPRASHAGSPLTQEEYTELSRLLSKLDENSQKANRGKKSRHKPEDNIQTHSLKKAKPSDFGTASGRVSFEQEEGPGFHEDQNFNPFGNFFGGQAQHFQFGSPGGPFGAPFGGGAAGHDDGHVQCEQM